MKPDDGAPRLIKPRIVTWKSVVRSPEGQRETIKERRRLPGQDALRDRARLRRRLAEQTGHAFRRVQDRLVHNRNSDSKPLVQRPSARRRWKTYSETRLFFRFVVSTINPPPRTPHATTFVQCGNHCRAPC